VDIEQGAFTPPINTQIFSFPHRGYFSRHLFTSSSQLGFHTGRRTRCGRRLSLSRLVNRFVSYRFFHR
jgi:hypothetical protein